MKKKNPYHIEVIGKAIGHVEVMSIGYAPVLDLDFSKGNIFEITLQGNLKLNVEKIIGGRTSIIFKQDNVGGHSVTYDSKFKLAEGDTGQPTVTAGSINVLDCVNDPETEEIFATMSVNYN